MHRPVFFQPCKRLTQNLDCTDVRWHNDPVMHPLAVAPGLHYSGAAEIRQVPGYFGLPLPQNLDKVADANLLFSHQVEKAKSSVVAEGLKKEFDIKG